MPRRGGGGREEERKRGREKEEEREEEDERDERDERDEKTTRRGLDLTNFGHFHTDGTLHYCDDPESPSVDSSMRHENLLDSEVRN